MNAKWIVILMLGPTIAHALSLDLRHEYLDDSQQNKDRLLLSHRFKNGLGMSVETKFRSGGDDSRKPMCHMRNSSNEYTLSYLQKMNKWNLQPGLAVETSTDKETWKPSLRLQYDFLGGIYTAVRYRYEYSHVSSTASHEENIHRGDFWLGYRWRAWKLEYNYLYKHSDQIRFDNRHDDYEHNLKLGRIIAQHWMPYVEVGNVSVSKTSGERQTRFRVGLNWSF